MHIWTHSSTPMCCRTSESVKLKACHLHYVPSNIMRATCHEAHYTHADIKCHTWTSPETHMSVCISGEKTCGSPWWWPSAQLSGGWWGDGLKPRQKNSPFIPSSIRCDVLRMRLLTPIHVLPVNKLTKDNFKVPMMTWNDFKGMVKVWSTVWSGLRYGQRQSLNFNQLTLNARLGH